MKRDVLVGQRGMHMSRVTASAPGKCILFGEHAVVYGQPAVAVALEQRISVSVENLVSDSGSWKIDGMHFQEKNIPMFKH